MQSQDLEFIPVHPNRCCCSPWGTSIENSPKGMTQKFIAWGNGCPCGKSLSHSVGLIFQFPLPVLGILLLSNGGN